MVSVIVHFSIVMVFAGFPLVVVVLVVGLEL
jgi:hypothetical protein